MTTLVFIHTLNMGEAKRVTFEDDMADGFLSIARKFKKKSGKDDSGLHGIAARLRMGKKLDNKEKGKDKNQSSASQDTQDDDLSKTPEPHLCTGNFQADFVELCRRQELSYVPPIVGRPKPPPSPSHVPEGKPEKGKDKNKQPTPPEPEPEVLDEDGDEEEDGDPPPKTYTTRDKFEYFKPAIQVEMENPDKLDTVAEVYIRGWKVDACMMNIFKQCWPAMERLHTINLWQVGLTGETVAILSQFLPLCTTLKSLILDGNWMKEENWHLLIDDDNSIQSLSLQHCAVTDKGAESIGKALGTAKKFNTKLLSLNLAGNRITDTGAEHIAGGLRMNRTLLSLSVANNRIGDKGVKKIAEALSRFPLTHEEVVERRRLISEKGSPERNKSPPPSRRADSKDRPGSVRSSSHMDKDKSKRDKPSAKNKKDPKAKEEDTKKGTKKEKDEKTSKKGPNPTVGGRSSGASIAADAGKTGGKGKPGRKNNNPKPLEQEMPDVLEVINPLMEVADYIPELQTLMVAGNRVLLNLNLDRNVMTEDGVRELTKAIQYQTTLLIDSKNSGTGLMRLSVQKNKVAPDSFDLKKLNDMMAPKHPLYKPPPTPDGDAA